MEITRRSLLKSGVAVGALAVGSPVLRALASVIPAEGTPVDLRIAAVGTCQASNPRLDLIYGNYTVGDLYELLHVKSLSGTGNPGLPPYETAIAVSGVTSKSLNAVLTSGSQPSVIVGGDPDPEAVTICVMPTKAFYPYSLDPVTTVVEFPAKDGTMLEEASATLPDSPSMSIDFLLADATLTKLVSSEVAILSLP